MEQEKDRIAEKKKAIFIGPWGGPGGNYWDDGSYSGVREIMLIYGMCVDSIRILYDKNGMPVLLEKHGGPGGNANAEVKLQFPYEYLIGVSGYYYPMHLGGNPMVRSLTFKSNWKTYGPFGVQKGTPFSLQMEGGKIVGFRGRCGLFVDAIGQKDETGERKAIVVGPWGGNGGTNWDNGCYNGIKLQFPEEFLTTVTGHYSPVVHGGSPVIRSLTLKSTWRTFAPFGVEEGTPFYFPMEGGQIVGFKGKGGWYLDAIGFHISRTKRPKVMQKVQQRFRRLTSSVFCCS
ncbi:hypothetical protein Pfo_019948 [Paulownia fortunei]|nr:hypothetical protein Pfo_019948 [Paulownia fortunei]